MDAALAKDAASLKVQEAPEQQLLRSSIFPIPAPVLIQLTKRFLVKKVGMDGESTPRPAPAPAFAAPPSVRRPRRRRPRCALQTRRCSPPPSSSWARSWARCPRRRQQPQPPGPARCLPCPPPARPLC